MSYTTYIYNITFFQVKIYAIKMFANEIFLEIIGRKSRKTSSNSQVVLKLLKYINYKPKWSVKNVGHTTLGMENNLSLITLVQ